MDEQETRVFYRALADFSQLRREARAAKRDLEALKKAEDQLNSSSAGKPKGKHIAESTAASQKDATAKLAQAAAQDKVTNAVRRGAEEFAKTAQAQKQAASSSEQVAKSADKAGSATRRAAIEAERLERASRRAETSAGRLSNAFQRAGSKFQQYLNIVGKGARETDRAKKGADGLLGAFNRLANFRPGNDMTVAMWAPLVGLLGSLLSLVNPLIAGLGAVGAAGFGFASSLGTIAGAALGAIPAITTLISVVSALKVAFGGVGKAFSLGRKVATSGGGGGGGSSAPATIPRAELTLAEKLARAQEDLRRATEDVTFAEEDLDDARKQAIKRINDLRKAVERAALAEKRARADAQLSLEEYYNVMADPSSTKGQKMDAAASLEEAQNAVNDVIEENIQNQEDLKDAEAKGVEGDRQVIMAKRRLADALDGVRDAELALQNVSIDAANANIKAADAASGAASAADQFQDALDKLSPSARSVVLQLLAMADAWDAVRREVQEAFFSEIVDDVWRLTLLFPALQSMLSDTAGALGRVARQLLLLVTSDKWIRDIELVGKQNIPIIENLGDAFVRLLDVFMDLTIAAGPFLINSTKAFRDWANALGDAVARGRETGSIATYLERVAEVTAQWWRIIKNVGSALYGYGQASRDFSQWLLDGLEQLSERWKTNGENAAKAGSPFQQYLENIKPLLSEINGLVGDFFGWFAKTSMDPRFIEQMTQIVQVFREELGPALSKVLSAWVDSDLPVKVVEAISGIVEVIAEFLDSGGAEAIEMLVDGLIWLLDVLKGIMEIPGAGGVLAGIIAGFLGLKLLAGVASIFAPITSFLGFLLKFGKDGKGLPGLLSKIGDNLWFANDKNTGKYGRASGGANIPTGARPSATTGSVQGPSVKPNVAPVGPNPYGVKPRATAASSGSGGIRWQTPQQIQVQTGLDPNPFRPGTFTPKYEYRNKMPTQAVGAAPRPNGSIPTPQAWNPPVQAASSTAKGAGKGVNWFSSLGNAIKGGSGSAKGAASGFNFLSSLGTNAVKGAGKGGLWGAVAGITAGVAIDAGSQALQGNKDPNAQMAGRGLQASNGLFAGLGGAAGAIGGPVGMAIGMHAGAGIDAILGGPEALEQWGTDTQNFLTQFLGELPAKIGEAAGNIWSGLQGIGQWFTDTWNGAQEFLANLPYNLGVAVGALWAQVLNFKDWLVETWNAAGEWLAGLPQRIGETLTNIWGFIVGLGPWLTERWNEFAAWAGALPGQVGQWFTNLWNNLPNALSWLGARWEEFRSWAVSLPGQVGSWFSGLWSGLPGIGNWLSSQWGNVLNWINSVISTVRSAFSSFFSGLTFGFSAARRNNGGIILRRARGGDVPGLVPGRGNGDVVDAKLTPGEFVLRKAIVNRIGEDNLARLNSGVMGYADLLKRANETDPTHGSMFSSDNSLVPSISKPSVGSNSNLGWTKNQDSSIMSQGSPIIGGNLVINNPIPEPASESLPNSIRKTAYLKR